jgi:hypothetical protein
MRNFGIIGGIIAVIAVVGIGLWFLVSISYNNQEIGLRNRGTAQVGKIEVVFDEMWKVFQDQAGITNQYKTAFHEIYSDIIGGRYSQGDGSLMKWVTEHNPEFDSSLFTNLMRSVEKYRGLFSVEQQVMLDIIRQHTDLLNMQPSSWFIKDKTLIEYTVISSSETKSIMDSGVDDRPSPFAR